MKQIERNTPLKLADQIEFKMAGVEFKTIGKSKHGEAVLVAVDKDQVIAEHSVDALAVAHILTGEMVFTVEGKEHRMKEGDSIILEPNAKHSLRAVTPFKMALAKINE